MKDEKKVLCLGAGFVGGPKAARIAYKYLRYRVTIVDTNKERIAQRNTATLPVYEPKFGLDRAGNEEQKEKPSILVVTVAGRSADIPYYRKEYRYNDPAILPVVFFR